MTPLMTDTERKFKEVVDKDTIESMKEKTINYKKKDCIVIIKNDNTRCMLRIENIKIK